MKTERISKLNKQQYKKGLICYWMSRDQRVFDNWALLRAQELAIKNKTQLVVVFNLLDNFLEATPKQFGFMIQGLKLIEKSLTEKNIQFILLNGEPKNSIPNFVKTNNIGCLITDYSPLNINRTWKKALIKELNVPFEEVDTHNVIPVWELSEKQEFAAYTIRPKVYKKIFDFLDDFPQLEKQNQITKFDFVNKWPNIKNEYNWESGEKKAEKVMEKFFEERLNKYSDNRNDPNKDAVSNLSPYLHFGQISAQRIILEIRKIEEEILNPKKNAAKKNKDVQISSMQECVQAFVEELVVRRELAENFCHYNKNYDKFEGFPNWAKETLNDERITKREFVYNLEQFENAKTHDDLWNAAQLEMTKTGKMHGYMRMYWAKKILEWTSSPELALKIAIYLNDKYELDGRDPNGYTGIAWSIGGVHDRAWFGRPVFGKVRYMSYNGAKNKFDIQKYIDKYVKK